MAISTRRPTRHGRSILFVFLVLVCLTICCAVAVGGEKTPTTTTTTTTATTCGNAREGTCSTSESTAATTEEQPACATSLPRGFCDTATDSSSYNKNNNGPPSSISIYRNGGTAQAYKPNAPLKTTVCEGEKYNNDNKKTRYKPATWPFWRSSQRSIPKLVLRTNILSCNVGTKDEEGEGPCCCRPISASSLALNNSTSIHVTDNNAAKEEGGGAIVLEIWQARPDGTYSSLRKGIEEGDCRARVSIPLPSGGTAATNNDTSFASAPSSVILETVAPGSSGSLGGLGPGRAEFGPYAPPALHLLVTSPGHVPTLIQVPILVHSKTYESRRFYGPNWTGQAWMKQGKKSQPPPYAVSDWKANPSDGRVDVTLDVFLQQQRPPQRKVRQEADEAHHADHGDGLSRLLCPSWVYGFPASFFLEPISVCAPALLDFFAL